MLNKNKANQYTERFPGHILSGNDTNKKAVWIISYRFEIRHIHTYLHMHTMIEYFQRDSQKIGMVDASGKNKCVTRVGRKLTFYRLSLYTIFFIPSIFLLCTLLLIKNILYSVLQFLKYFYMYDFIYYICNPR